MSREDCKTIGTNIKLVQFRWLLGLPLVRKMEAGLWEVRSQLQQGQIARVFFTVEKTQLILLYPQYKNSL